MCRPCRVGDYRGDRAAKPAVHRKSKFGACGARGIHSGWVVIDQLGTNKVEIFGDTPNIASRVQAKCAPNSVLITNAVHDLIASQFIVEDCGAHTLAGIARPVQLYRAIGPSGVNRSWRRDSVRGPTLFVNRKHEFDALSSSWLAARTAWGRMFF